MSSNDEIERLDAALTALDRVNIGDWPDWALSDSLDELSRVERQVRTGRPFRVDADQQLEPAVAACEQPRSRGRCGRSAVTDVRAGVTFRACG